MIERRMRSLSEYDYGVGGGSSDTTMYRRCALEDQERRYTF